MAKGRKLTTTSSERLLGSYNGYGHSYGADDVAEFGEEDVWSAADDVVGDRDNGDMENSRAGWGPRAGAESDGRNHSRIPRGGLSLAFEDSGVRTAQRILHQFRGNEAVAAPSPRGHHMATSAPVNVPDWSKIYRVDSVESLHDSDDGFEERDAEMVPPHEYLAREYARSRKSAATSVFEGVGRTLKGRDMRRVRDAVWSQTGFDG